MTDQLSATDWLDQGLKTLARSGFTALKAEPLAKAMGVSRGSFYWHFADVGAFHAAILRHWREVAAEQIIADLEAASASDVALPLLLRRAFGARLSLEKAIRTWATFDPAAGAAVQAIDRRRLGYVEKLLLASGLSPQVAAARRRSCIGLRRICAFGQAVAAGKTGVDARRIAADGLAMTPSGYPGRSNMLRDRATKPEALA